MHLPSLFRLRIRKQPAPHPAPRVSCFYCALVSPASLFVFRAQAILPTHAAQNRASAARAVQIRRSQATLAMIHTKSSAVKFFGRQKLSILHNACPQKPAEFLGYTALWGLPYTFVCPENCALCKNKRCYSFVTISGLWIFAPKKSAFLPAEWETFGPKSSNFVPKWGNRVL